MFVILPEKLAASHLRECERHLNECEESHIGLLYAAQFAYMALNTIVVTARYSEIGTQVMRSEGKQTYPGGPKEGGTIKDFRSLIEGIEISEDEREALMLLSDIRDRLQHPIPGPMGYVIAALLRVIEVAVKVGMEMWNHPNMKLNADSPARVEAFAASDAILALCSMKGSQNVP